MTKAGRFRIQASNLGPFIEMRGGTIVLKSECNSEQWREAKDGKYVNLYF